MAFSVRKGGSVVAGLTVCLAAGMTMPAQAQNKYWADDGGTNLLKLEPARRFMLRFGYTYINPDDTSSDTEDITGPVVAYDPSVTARVDNSGFINNEFLHRNLMLGMAADYVNKYGSAPPAGGDYGIGIPAGVRNDARGAGSPTVSLVTFIDDERKWAVEGFLLAVPFKNDVYGAGIIGGDPEYKGFTVSQQTLGQSTPSQKILTTQQLPVTVILHRFFGRKDAKIRFSAGLGLSYAIFFDTHATKDLEDYAGGPTKVKIKNAFGAGPFVGLSYALDDRWSLNAQVGYVKLKTSATITTQVDPARLARSPARLQGAATLGEQTAIAVALGDTLPASNIPALGCTSSMLLTECLLRDLARLKTGDPNNLGTYKRKIETNLDPWVFNVSVGYSF